MLTFWRYGYETTSVADLTAAMGVNAPSIYAAFGDKKQLFLESLNLYLGPPEMLEQTLQAAPTAREAARKMLLGSADAFTGIDTPAGCLLASATATGSEAAADVRARVAQIRQTIETMLQARIERDMAVGILPAETSASGLAALVIGVIQGLSVLARDGAGREKLRAVAELALNAWPAERAELR